MEQTDEIQTKEILVIVNIIENTQVNSFIQSYKNKIYKITQVFKMFIASFYCYLKHDSKKDFVIDFDNVWKWLGFTRKDNAKTCLEKHFLKEIDYKVEKAAPAIAGAAFSTL